MSASSSSPPVTWLPDELLLDAFKWLESPIDLYSASLVCHHWQALATESQLWERHYWRFYRASSHQDDQLSSRDDRKRHAAMRGWVKMMLNEPTTDCLSPFLCSGSNLSTYEPYRPFVNGLLAIIEVEGFYALAKALRESTSFVLQQWAPQGPDDAATATPQLLRHLMKSFGLEGQRSPSRGLYAVARYDHFVKTLRRFVAPQPPDLDPLSLPPLPHFLRDVKTEIQALDLHALFVKRMNSDQRLLAELQAYIRAADNTLSKLLDLIHRYGDQSRDLLAALAAHQRLTAQTVSIFLNDKLKPEESRDKTNVEKSALKDTTLRALDVHEHALGGSSQPLPSSCLSLQHTARHLLGHLQRREAVRSMKKLKVAWAGKASQLQPVRDDIIKCCIGVEDALASLTLFRSGDKDELRRYLDLLAVYVWSSLKAQERSLVAKGLKLATHSAAAKYSLSTCTRDLVTAIHGILRVVGFGVAWSDDYYDVTSNFLYLALWCPGQRNTLPITLTAITCAVARRLGVATTLVGTADHPLAIVIEDGPEPANWRSNRADQEWGHFFMGPGFITKEMESNVLDSSLVESWLVETGATADTGASVESLLDPVSPLTVLEWAATNIIGTLQHAPPPPPPPLQPSAASHEGQLPPTSSGARNELAALRAYIMGRQAQPPLPLSTPLLPTTLAFLPSTRAGTPRVDRAPDNLDEEYAASMALRIVAPEMLGGPREAEDQIFDRFLAEAPESCAADGAYRGDMSLLFEINGRDVMAEMKAARMLSAEEMEQGTDPEREGGRRSQQPRSPMYLRGLLTGLLALDSVPSNGLGGVGGGWHGLRRYRQTTQLADLNPSLSSNARVKHRVGTVIQHRDSKSYGVVIGWDVSCRLPEVQIPYVQVDDLTEEDTVQPCYHILDARDGTHHYVAQRSIEAVRVPAGSTVEEAAAILRKLLPLFNLRTVGKCFRTVHVEPWAVGAKGGKAKKKGKAARSGESEEGGRVKLVMNEWMQGAWPYD